MAEIFPFQAYRYDTARVELARVLTQPYDKITPAMQERYYGLDPHNLIVIEKGRGRPQDNSQENVHTRAAQALKDWIEQGILVRDPAPAVYVYSQEYNVPPNGERRVRKGFIALGRVEDYSANVVFRHEQTLAAPKADRLELLRHTRAHTGQLFMLYADPERRIDARVDQVTRATAPAEVHDEFDVLHRLWPVATPEIVEWLRGQMARKKLVIADGHHRYETALAYRNECRARTRAADRHASYEKVMMTFFNAHGEGLTILPTHRVVAGVAGFDFERFRRQLEPHFELRRYAFAGAAARAASVESFRRDLECAGQQGRAIGLYAETGAGGDGAFWLLVLRGEANLAVLLPDLSPLERQLDVALLHRLVLEKGLGIATQEVAQERHISYEREFEAAIAAVDHGKAQLCCLLNPVRVQQVMDIALAGGVLPQKSTDFYPKLLSGLTIYRLDG